MSLSQIKDVAVSGVYALYYVNSWVRSWFASPSLTMDETIAQLECVREKVYQREKNLREQMEEHRTLAIEYAKKKQTREAKMQIRLRLLYDNQLVNVQKTLTAIESHVIAVQSASLNRDVFLALNDSSRALGDNIQDEDFVDDVLETLDEQTNNAQHIMELINSKPLDVSALEDDDIEHELKSLMNIEEENVKTVTIENTATLPEFPMIPTLVKPKKEAVSDSI